MSTKNDVSPGAGQGSAHHATFVIERVHAFSPAQVFAAWATAAAKARWFAGPADKWTLISRELDFRAGGQAMTTAAI